MGAFAKALLLFTLNWLDAQLTILWLRLDVATEGNRLMAALLTHGESSFLIVKLMIGALAGYTLYRFAKLPIARRGMKLAFERGATGERIAPTKRRRRCSISCC